MYSTACNLWTFTWFVHFELPFRLKGTEKLIPRDSLNSPLIYILFSMVTVPLKIKVLSSLNHVYIYIYIMYECPEAESNPMFINKKYL